MKELWTTNPFHLVNGSFAEMSYNSSGPNIAPTHLLLAMHAPLTGPPRTIRLLPAQHPSAPCMPSARQLTVQCPPTSPQTTRQRTAQHLLSLCKPPAVILGNRCWSPAQHPSSHGAASADPCAPSSDSLQAICWHEPMPLAACMSEPSSRTNTLSPCKNTLRTIVNCPLQIKPVFYFLFTSTAPPAHRIRVKSSLLRLGRFCLALPFTHLGKDIT